MEAFARVDLGMSCWDYWEGTTLRTMAALVKRKMDAMRDAEKRKDLRVGILAATVVAAFTGEQMEPAAFYASLQEDEDDEGEMTPEETAAALARRFGADDGAAR